MQTLPATPTSPTAMDTLLYWIGLVAVAVSALTGVLDAGRKQMDIVGAVMVGCATALGGGTVRDVLLDRTVFWINDQTYLLVAILTTLVVFLRCAAWKLPQRLFLIPTPSAWRCSPLLARRSRCSGTRRGWWPACSA